MHLEEDNNLGRFAIKRVEPHAVTINDTTYNHSLIVGLNALAPDWRPTSVAELTLADCEAVLALQPELVLLGTGTQFKLPTKPIIEFFESRHIGFEFMDTAAACRTFIILTAEGRNVAAALIIAN